MEKEIYFWYPLGLCFVNIVEWSADKSKFANKTHGLRSLDVTSRRPMGNFGRRVEQLATGEVHIM